MKLPSITIRGELHALVLGIALPFIAVIAYLLYDTTRGDMEQATGGARRLAEVSAARIERFLGDFRVTLAVIASMRPLAAEKGLELNPCVALGT